MSMTSERMAAIKTASTGTALPNMVVDGIDLTIPKVLLRKGGKRLTNEEARKLADPKQRDWAPMRPPSEVPKRAPMPVLATDVTLPVRVQVKDPKKAGSTFLKEYPDFASFEKKHDRKNYPIKSTHIFEGNTIVIVTAKFWVNKAKPEPSEKKPSRSKTDIIAGLLLRPEGCVTSEVLEACSWPAVSMPAQAKLAGLKLRKEKQGKVTRYWGSK